MMRAAFHAPCGRQGVAAARPTWQLKAHWQPTSRCTALASLAASCRGGASEAAITQPAALRPRRPSRLHAQASASKGAHVDTGTEEEDVGGEEEWEEEEDGEWEEGDEFGEAEDEAEEEEAGDAAGVGGTAGAADAPATAGSTTRRIPADAETTEYTEADFVEVGTVGKAHGLRGEAKVMPATDEPKKRFAKRGRRLWLLPPRGPALARTAGAGAPMRAQLQRVLVESGRKLKAGASSLQEVWGVKFKGVETREQAAKLTGQRLLLALCDREPLPSNSDEFYVQDLIGLEAVHAATQQVLGSVVEVYDGTGTYDTLRVRLLPDEKDVRESRTRSVLIPFAKEICPSVDVRQRRLLVDPPEGLLEVVTSKKLRRPYTPQQQAVLLHQVEQRLASLGKEQQQQQQQQAQPPPQQQKQQAAGS